MGKEAAFALREAYALLAQLRDPEPSSPKPSRIRVEHVSQKLLRVFRETMETRYFSAFYHLSRDRKSVV